MTYIICHNSYESDYEEGLFHSIPLQSSTIKDGDVVIDSRVGYLSTSGLNIMNLHMSRVPVATAGQESGDNSGMC